MFRFITILVLVLVFFSNASLGQSVGLVLSGGGAKGFAHIGVIQALEENNIPIDYISGTSMGAIVAGLYAIGYSPAEMAELLRSDDFLRWSYGEINIEDQYYFKLKNEDPMWAEFSLKVVDGIFTPQLPTNLISPEQMDLRFMQFFEPAGSGVNYDFNKLFVPFYCMATDVHRNAAIALNSGNLSTAIRASMTFPGYFKPIEIDSVLLFDGGMENNFPIDVMIEKYNPGFLIGSKVASNPKKPDADDLYRQLENVFMKSTNYTMPENGFLLEPDVSDFGLLDLEGFDSIYATGYKTTIENMDSIKTLFSRRVDINEVNARRQKFKEVYKELVIGNIYITGVHQETVDYILKNIRRNRDILTFKEFEQEYFKLLSDKLIFSVYPRIIYNEVSGYFDLYLAIKTKNEFSITLGGNISSNLRNIGFGGIDYIFQKKNVYNLSANFMIGQFYNSITGKFRMDFPPRNAQGDKILSPYYIDISATSNALDYFQLTTDWFIDSESPIKVEQTERHFQSNFGRPVNNRGLVYSGFSYGQTSDNYFHSNLVGRSDIPDETVFDYSSVHVTYEYNTLNFKQYPTKGKLVRIQGRYVTGLEAYTPGTTTGLANPLSYNDGHSWVHIQGNYKRFFETTKHFKLGVNGQLNYSTKGTFNNSMATLLSAYAFQPFPQSKLVLLENFRANTFAAAGIMPILVINEYLSIQAETYVFQPYQYINISDYENSLSKTFPTPSITASLAAVYQSPLGPLSLTASYFLNEEIPYYFQLNFGYILFNKRGLD